MGRIHHRWSNGNQAVADLDELTGISWGITTINPFAAASADRNVLISAPTEYADIIRGFIISMGVAEYVVVVPVGTSHNNKRGMYHHIYPGTLYVPIQAS